LHPMSKFGSGNLQTLLHTPQEDGVDVRAHLLDFHSDYYSANNMRVCVVGKESLEELEMMVTDKFSDVPCKDIPVPSWDAGVFDGVALPQEVIIRPVKETRSISMIFPIPWGSTTYWRSKPGGYWSMLLGHEGEGSIMELVKSKGWVNSLSAGASYGASDFSSFSVFMGLTEQGMSHVDELVEMVFAYVRIVREGGAQEWVFRERQRIAETHFLLRPKGDGYSQTSTIANNMQYYPPEYVLAGPTTYHDWDPEKVMEFGSHLTPENLLLYVTNPDLTEAEDNERWYNTPYTKREISVDRVAAWSSPRKWPEFHLHDPNPFVPDNLDLVPLPDTVPSHPIEAEPLSSWGRLCRLWHRQDNTFFEPRVVLCADFVSDVMRKRGITAHVLSYLWVDMVDDDLAKPTYDASCAGFGYSFRRLPRGAELQVVGYTNKLVAFIETVVQSILKDYSDSEDRFQVLKERYRRVLGNTSQDRPVTHASREADTVLTNENFAFAAQLETLEGLELPDLLAFVEEFFESLHLRTFVHGNIVETDAVSLVDITLMQSLLGPVVRGSVFPPSQDGLHPSPRARIELPVATTVPGPIYRRQRMRLPLGTECLVSCAIPSPEDQNNALVMYFQIGQSDTYRDVALDVLGAIMSPIFFQKLRTEQQLGYLVACGPSQEYYATGYKFAVQSNVAHPHVVRQRVLEFLESFHTYLQDLSTADVARTVQSMAQKWSEPEKQLVEQASRDWGEINSEHYFWERKEKVVQRLLSVTKAEVLALYEAYFMDQAPGTVRACLSVFSHSHRYPIDATKPLDVQVRNMVCLGPGIDLQEVTDAQEYKRSLNLFKAWVPPPTMAAEGR